MSNSSSFLSVFIAVVIMLTWSRLLDWRGELGCKAVWHFQQCHYYKEILLAGSLVGRTYFLSWNVQSLIAHEVFLHLLSYKSAISFQICTKKLWNVSPSMLTCDYDAVSDFCCFQIFPFIYFHLLVTMMNEWMVNYKGSNIGANIATGNFA